jgi:hypothetical protein
MIGLGNRISLLHHLAVYDGVGDSGAGILEDVGPGAVRRLPVAELPEQAERSAPQLDAPTAVRIDRSTVVRVVVRGVPPDVTVQEGSESTVLDNHVDHARYGV